MSFTLVFHHLTTYPLVSFRRGTTISAIWWSSLIRPSVADSSCSTIEMSGGRGSLAASYLIRCLSASIYNHPSGILVCRVFSVCTMRSYRIWLDLAKSSLPRYSVSSWGEAYARLIIKSALFRVLLPLLIIIPHRVRSLRPYRWAIAKRTPTSAKV